MDGENRQQHSPRQRWLAGVSLRATDAGLASTVLLAPLFFGGRNGLGLLVYAALVSLTAAAWLIRVFLSPGSAAPVNRAVLGMVAAAIAVVAIQLVPLPSSVLATLAPGATARLTLWPDASLAFPAWKTISVDPWSTRIALATLLTHAVLLLVALQRVRSTADAARLIRLVAIAGSAVAVLGLLQYLSRTEQLLWCYPLAYRRVQDAVLGPFTTPNHCGQFLAVGAAAVFYEIVTALIAAARAGRRPRPHTPHQPSLKPEQIRVAAWTAAMGAILLAVMFTYSRGAVLALAASVSVTGVALCAIGWVGRAAIAKGMLLLLVGAVGLAYAKYDHAANNAGGFDVTQLSELTDTSTREAIWTANIHAFTTQPILGWGAGAHAQFYQLFLDDPGTTHFTHAESGYLQIASESGAIGVALLACAVGFVTISCLRCLAASDDEHRAALCAVALGALASSLVQSIADFVWYIPSCVAPVALLAAAAIRLGEPFPEQTSDAVRADRRRFPATATLYFAVTCVAAALLFAPGAAAPAIHRYDRVSATLKQYSRSMFARTSDSGDLAMVQRVLESKQYYLGQMLEELKLAAQRDAGNSATHLKIARLSVQAFEVEQALGDNPLGVDAIREAAAASGFSSLDEQAAWLSRAYGDSSQLLYGALRHARRAAELCPLQGEGYLLLADLGFLDTLQSQDHAPLVDQALRVRPYRGSVLFDAGRRRYAEGNGEAAIELWRRAAKLPGSHREKLTIVLTQIFAADAFVKEFSPDWELTQAAFRSYERMGRAAELRVLAEHAVATARQGLLNETPRLAALHWHQAGQIMLSLDEPERAAECAKHAIEIDASVFHFRYLLAEALFKVDRYEEADPHIRWCVARQPDNPHLRKKLEAIAKQRSVAARTGWQRNGSRPAESPLTGRQR